MAEHYKVTGRSCAACSARVEKAVSALEGADEVSVNLLTGTMTVGGSVSSDAVIDAVVKAGYGASLEGKTDAAKSTDDAFRDTETPKLKKRLAWSVGFLAVLMYFSMGHSMWGFPGAEVFRRQLRRSGTFAASSDCSRHDNKRQILHKRLYGTSAAFS